MSVCQGEGGQIRGVVHVDISWAYTWLLSLNHGYVASRSPHGASMDYCQEHVHGFAVRKMKINEHITRKKNVSMLKERGLIFPQYLFWIMQKIRLFYVP